MRSSSPFFASPGEPACSGPASEGLQAERLRQTLHQLGMALRAGADLEETLHTVTDLARQIAGAGSAALRLEDADGRFTVRAISGGDEVQPLRDLSFSIDEGVIGQVARERRPSILNQFDPLDHPFAETVRRTGIRRLLCVPILSAGEGRALGTLTVHNKQDDRPFVPQDAETLTAFAAHAAVAVERAVLREEQRQAAREACILHDIASATTSLNLPVVLSVALDKAAEVAGDFPESAKGSSPAQGAVRCAILLYDPDHAQLSWEASTGEETRPGRRPDEVVVPLPPADPLFLRLVLGEPTETPDPGRRSAAEARLLSALSAGPHTLFPILNQGQMIGVLAVSGGRRANPLSARQCRILQSIGRQIAAAVANVRLVEQADDRVKELSALRQISQAIASSMEPRPMLEKVLSEVIAVMEASAGSIMLYLPERRALRIEAAGGLKTAGRRTDQPIDRGVAGWVATHREALLVGNVSQDPRFRLVAERPEITSAIVVPLLAKHHLLGVLSVSTSGSERRYTERDLNLMKTMASTIAVALENARHYDAERQIAQIARAALLPRIRLSRPGLDIGEKHVPAFEVGGDYYHLFEIDPRRVGILVSDVAGKGVPAAMHAAMGKHFIRALCHRCDSPAEALAHANVLLARETPPEIFITLFFGMLDVETGDLVYSNAGHVSPFIARTDHTLEELSGTGMVLGLWEEGEFGSARTTLRPGEVLLCYTDGVTEAKRGTELFGEARLKSALQKHWQRPAQEIVDLVYRRTITFCGKKTGDDLALLAIKRVKG